jgi:ABC-type Fe3+/spermidine/putrescine transport system ATPase subunit
MIRLVVDGLTRRIDDLAVVERAGLEARPGELVVVLGPSGAGKTTLARLIAGLEPSDQGEIYFNGRVMNAVPPRDRRVGMVFQDDALWPHLTVAENVGLVLKSESLTRRERRRRVDDALDRVRVDAVAGKRPEALTTPQRRRVAIARALAGDPGLLILDEPLGPLSGRARDEFREEFRQLHAQLEITTLLLTRDSREALALADRLAVMDLGRIVQFGGPAEVYNSPVDAVVAQLLGPTNLLQGQVEGTDPRGAMVVRTPLGRLIGRTSGGPIPDGSLVTVSIRPEVLGLGTLIPPDANRFAATLERQVFLGEVRRLNLRGPGDWPVLAVALQVHSQGLREGQGLTVSVHPDHVVIMPGRYASPRPPA